jgi:hypothetical protein
LIGFSSRKQVKCQQKKRKTPLHDGVKIGVLSFFRNEKYNPDVKLWLKKAIGITKIT